MNKFDEAGFARMMARMQAEEAVPGGGPITEFAASDAPQVCVGEIEGRAVAYSWHHGLVEWTDSKGLHHFDWFPAEHIRRTQDHAGQ